MKKRISKPSARIIIISVIFIGIIAFFLWERFKPVEPDDSVQEGELAKEDSFLLYCKNTEIAPFRITIVSAAYNETLPDSDGYYEKKGRVAKLLSTLRNYESVDTSYEGNTGYLTVDLTVECLKSDLSSLTEAKQERYRKEPPVLSLENIRLASLYDGKEEGISYDGSSSDGKPFNFYEASRWHDLPMSDFKVLKGDPETLTEAQPKFNLKEGETMELQLLYVCPFTAYESLYHPVLVFEPTGTAGGKMTLERMITELPVTVYQTPWPMECAYQGEQLSRREISAQENDNALFKAEGDWLNPTVLSEKADLEAYQLFPDQKQILKDPKTPAYSIHLDSQGKQILDLPYTMLSETESSVYDSLKELPSGFSDSKALQTVTKRYVEELGFTEKDLRYLVVRCRYYAYKGVYCNNLQNLWFYCEQKDGSLLPCGNPDDYRIVECDNPLVTPDSTYVYQQDPGGDEAVTAVVELVFVCYPDCTDTLYLCPNFSIVDSDMLKNKDKQIDFIKLS